MLADLRLAWAVGVAPDGTFCTGEGRQFLADALLPRVGPSLVWPANSAASSSRPLVSRCPPGIDPA
jgi:hypothetical protein